MGSIRTLAAPITKGWFWKHRLSLHHVRTHRSRTEPPFADVAIAHAENQCTCSEAFAAAQRISPNRSLKTTLRCNFQTALSPQADLTIETRDTAGIGFPTFAHAAFVCAHGESFVATQFNSRKRSLPNEFEKLFQANLSLHGV